MDTSRIQQLVETLEKAVAHKEAHAKAQDNYFSDIEGGCEEAPFTHCGTACCIAGDVAMRVALEEGFLDEAYGPRQVVEGLHACFKDKECDGPWALAQMYYGLSNLEASLVFNASTHWRIHQTVAEVFKQGLRFPQDKDYAAHMNGGYLNFVGALLSGIKDIAPPRFTGVEEFCRYLKTLAAPAPIH
jgi:hypothetical protein